MFKKYAIVLMFFSIIAQSAYADLTSVCGTVKELGACQYKSNSPVRSCSALTCPIARFALNPTIIFTNEVGACGNQAKLGSANIYDKAGNLLCAGAQRLGCAAKRGTCLSRYKADETACNTRVVVKKAIRNTGSPEIFWKVAQGTCFRVPDAGKCYNVKAREVCLKTIR